MKSVNLIAGLQVAAVAVAILIVSGVFKLSGYNEWKDIAYYTWNPIGVFVRNWGFSLFLIPVLWLAWMLFARAKLSVTANRISMIAGWAIVVILLLVFTLYPAAEPYRQGLLIGI